MVKLERDFSLNKFILAASPSKINERDIKLVMFNTEKIFKQPFKVNEDIYNQINQFNNKIHIVKLRRYDDTGTLRK